MPDRDVSTNPGAVIPSPVDERPVCMQILGLLPPYSLDDIHKAYKAQAGAAHPDKGGSPEQFFKIQEAYEQAQEYLKFRQGRRQWMANLVEPYVKQQEVVEQIRRRHGDVEIERIDWMQHSFGDFALLTERLRRIEFRDMANTDEFLNFLVGYNEDLRYLNELDLAGSDLTDGGLSTIVRFQSLRRLNLARTRITARGLVVIGTLPDLAWINLSGISLNWWDRRSLRRWIPRAELIFQ